MTKIINVLFFSGFFLLCNVNAMMQTTLWTAFRLRTQKNTREKYQKNAGHFQTVKDTFVQEKLQFLATMEQYSQQINAESPSKVWKRLGLEVAEHNKVEISVFEDESNNDLDDMTTIANKDLVLSRADTKTLKQYVVTFTKDEMKANMLMKRYELAMATAEYYFSTAEPRPEALKAKILMLSKEDKALTQKFLDYIKKIAEDKLFEHL